MTRQFSHVPNASNKHERRSTDVRAYYDHNAAMRVIAFATITVATTFTLMFAVFINRFQYVVILELRKFREN